VGANQVVDTVLIDQEGDCAPRASNDRLLLGLEGSLNGHQLDLLRQRAFEVLRRTPSAANLSS